MSNGTGTWLVAYWDELESVDKGPLVPGSPVHGVFQLPPPLLDFGFTNGLWRRLNAQLGTNFDFAESEDLPPDLLAVMAKSVRQHALEEYGNRAPGEVVRTAIGKRVSQPEGALVGEIPADEAQRWMTGFADFLAEAARAGKTVTILM
jgi:hypothetical protein